MWLHELTNTRMRKIHVTKLTRILNRNIINTLRRILEESRKLQVWNWSNDTLAINFRQKMEEHISNNSTNNPQKSRSVNMLNKIRGRTPRSFDPFKLIARAKLNFRQDYLCGNPNRVEILKLGEIQPSG